jgi:O-antigen/teichoic acid export membrane protein
MTNTKKAQTLKQRVMYSSMWVFAGQFGGQFLRLLSNLVMTRLLVPDMFGVMAVANTLIVGLQLCSYLGVQHNIIQSPRGDDRLFLNTAWSVQIIRGALLWLIALLIAGGFYIFGVMQWIPTGSVYAAPVLPAVIAVLSFTALISGFESTKLATASRHMVLSRLTILELGSQILGLVIMVSFAMLYPSIWALVVGTVISSTIKMLLSHVLMPGERNKLSWEWRAFHELFGFGKWILLTTILGFFVRNSDKLILAGLVTPQIMGVYSIAIFMINALQDVMTRWASAVVLPVLSQVQRNNAADLARTHYRFRRMFDLAVLFCAGFLFHAGYAVIEILYDARYASAGPMIQILALWFLGARTILAEQCYLALGRPRMAVPMNILQLVFQWALLIPAYHYFGMNGAVVVIVLSILITLPLTWYFLHKFQLLSWKHELLTLPALLVGWCAGAFFVVIYQWMLA